MDKITIIVPCYNEAEVIPRFYEAVAAATAAVEDCAFSYLFIDDGSRDGTLDAIRALADAHDNVRYLSFTRNFGKEPAMMAGLDFADGDAVLIMDADLQHPPALIPTMVAAWREGYDDVCGKRTDRKDETFLKRTMANFFYRSMQAVSRFTLQRDVGDFRLLDHRCVAALRLLRENQRFTKGLFTWVGFKKKEIPFQVPALARRRGDHLLYDRAAAPDDGARAHRLRARALLHGRRARRCARLRRPCGGLSDAHDRPALSRRRAAALARDHRRVPRTRLYGEQAAAVLSDRRAGWREI